MSEASPVEQDKFRRYRARKKAQGLREVRLWALDAHAPGFREELGREIAQINRSKDSAEVQAWLDECTAELWDKYP